MKKLAKTTKWKKIIIWILVIGIFFQSIPIYAEENSDFSLEDNSTIAVFPENYVEETSLNVLSNIEPEIQGRSISGSVEEDTTTLTEETKIINETVKEDTVDLSHIYENKIIKIYNAKQLQAIGTGIQVHSEDDQEFGKGEPIVVNGESIIYGMDSKYQIMNNIPLDYENPWVLPTGFTGQFVGSEVKKDSTLYDEDTDTIHIYHNYQLLTIASGEGDKQPIMSQDLEPDKYGIGQFLYAKGEENEQNYLKYSNRHHYVIDQNFTEAMPKMKAAAVKEKVTVRANDEENSYGRDYIGQVIYTDETRKEYILIGNQKQLKQIGVKTGTKRILI